MNILTVVYGDKYLSMFKNGCLASLAAPKNKAALFKQRSKWHVFTEEKYMHQLMEMFEEKLPGLDVKIRSVTELRDYCDAAQSAIVKMIKNSLETKSLFLMAPPDTIFGDGSITGMIEKCIAPGDCVAVAHPRVLPSILNEPTVGLKNEELVSLSWRHLHRAWSEAEVGHMNQNSYIGGVAWERISDKEIKVIHRLPTIYLCDFLPVDLDYFITVPGFGHYDHKWPGDVLVNMNRQRYIRHSDTAFIVEITEAHKNVPPQSQGPKDEFWQKNDHNELNAKQPVVFKMK